MPVVSVEKNPERLTLTTVSEFDAPIGRLWELWEDPRQLEKWWGPPEYPATFVEHDLTPGSRVAYFMTGPEGEQYRGWWRIVAVEPPHRIEFEDGFADEAGNPNPDMPTMAISVELTETDDGSRMTIHTRFPSLEVMEELAAMGMEEGMLAALSQIDDLLAASATT